MPTRMAKLKKKKNTETVSVDKEVKQLEVEQAYIGTVS